jgi:hypothetical protein
MAKQTEIYVTYMLDGSNNARIRKPDLKWLVKKAGLYLHRPDKGTGVVVIHAYKDRADPRQYAKSKRK